MHRTLAVGVFVLFLGVFPWEQPARAEEPFLIFPVVSSKTAGAVEFRFERAVKYAGLPNEIHGHYGGAKIAGINLVADARISGQELGGAPFSCLKISFKKEGYSELADRLQHGGSGEYVIVLGGKVYAAMKREDLLQIAQKQGRLVVVFPQRTQPATIEELVKRIKGELTR